jgi:hypothetical protein
LIIFLVVIYAGNFLESPPPSYRAVGVGFAGSFQWLPVAWAYEVDLNRISFTHEV